VGNNNITVFLEVYNEAHRLEVCLRNFLWAEELVVFVKESSDNTYDIAKKYATHVYKVEYSIASENFRSHVSNHISKEWCLFITASSLIDPELTIEIERLTRDKNFRFDVIGLPYLMHVLGIADPRSPWGQDYKYSLIRRSVLCLSDVLHSEISWLGNNVYKIDAKSTSGRFYHCTHSGPEDFFLRHMRYVAYEAKHLNSVYGDRAFKVSFIDLLRSIGKVGLKRKSFLMGRDGFMLSLAYVSYFIMRIVYVWYGLRNCEDPYSILRKASIDKWSKFSKVQD
jgi:(heptosyl)LPS beta-1,4-glucosyltransferase